MRINKKFSVIEIEKEIDFLKKNIQKGLIPYKIDYQGYYFREGDKIENPSIIVEFFYIDDEDLEKYYMDKGYDLIIRRKTDKGVWLYYLSENPQDDIKIREDDMSTLLSNISSRLDVFWMIIFTACLLFSLFMTFIKGKTIFIFIAIISLCFIIYLFFVKQNIKSLLKKFK